MLNRQALSRRRSSHADDRWRIWSLSVHPCIGTLYRQLRRRVSAVFLLKISSPRVSSHIHLFGACLHTAIGKVHHFGAIGVASQAYALLGRFILNALASD